MQRPVDIALSIAALLVLSPLFVIVAVAIMVSSPGHPFYRGLRVGKDGRPFCIWKFRTMAPNAAAIGPAITVKDDPRVTRLGRLLRKSKLDELPQFINVLLGDMTLVGPRPEDPEIVTLYSTSERVVLSVRPGLTGVVQLATADESETIPPGQLGREYYVQHLLPRKLSQDLNYLETRTALTDARILFRTLALVVNRLIGI